MQRLLLAILTCGLLVPMSLGASFQQSNPDVVYGPGALLLETNDIGNELTVVAFGAERTGRVPVVVLNATDTTSVRILVRLQARDADGKLVAAGDGYVKPESVPAGGLAIGYVSVSGGLPVGSSVTFEVQGQRSARLDTVPLSVVSADFLDDRIVGELRNPEAFTLGSIWGMAVCLGKDGSIADFSFLNIEGTIASGETVAFQETIESCVDFLLNVYAYPA